MSGSPNQWASRIGLILAVTGSAVGLGNFLRFAGEIGAKGVVIHGMLSPVFLPKDRPLAEQIESALRAEIVAQPCHALIEWGPWVQANPALTVDGIHPTTEGKQALAAMIAAATN